MDTPPSHGPSNEFDMRLSNELKQDFLKSRAFPFNSDTECRSTPMPLMPTALAVESFQKKEIIRVVIADDHAAVAEMLRYILIHDSGAQRFEVLAECKSVEETLKNCLQNEADLLIMDVCMESMSPLEMIEFLQKKAPTLRVLIFSRWLHPSFFAGFIKTGVHSIVFKSDGLSHLRQAIATVTTGGRYFSPQIETMTLGKIFDGVDCLTERERVALCFIAEGRSTKEMASLMQITPKTGEKYRERIMAKLHLRDAVQLTHFAIRCGLVAL